MVVPRRGGLSVGSSMAAEIHGRVRSRRTVIIDRVRRLRAREHASRSSTGPCIFSLAVSVTSFSLSHGRVRSRRSLLGAGKRARRLLASRVPRQKKKKENRVSYVYTSARS